MRYQPKGVKRCVRTNRSNHLTTMNATTGFREATFEELIAGKAPHPEAGDIRFG